MIGKIVNIDGYFYKIRALDSGFFHSEDKGLWRAHRVRQDWNGFWSCDEDDDFMIDQDMNIVARETGWGLTRMPYKKEQTV